MGILIEGRIIWTESLLYKVYTIYNKRDPCNLNRYFREHTPPVMNRPQAKEQRHVCIFKETFVGLPFQQVKKNHRVNDCTVNR